MVKKNRERDPVDLTEVVAAISTDILELPESSDIPLHDLILEAIENVKPPSKWRDIFFFMLLGMLGGIGLGIILPW